MTDKIIAFFMICFLTGLAVGLSCAIVMYILSYGFKVI